MGEGGAIAADLVGLGLTANPEPFSGLLQSPQGEGILAAAKTLKRPKKQQCNYSSGGGESGQDCVCAQVLCPSR
ncbi:MAG: hypothetical protein HC890_08165 [Chloroflexaceae bacterium]|nr:hypothetical protein [Chloroflexaceae bacterium]